MIWYMGYTHHQIKGKEKENDDTACGLHTASSNERGNKKKKKKKKKKTQHHHGSGGRHWGGSLDT